MTKHIICQYPLNFESGSADRTIFELLRKWGEFRKTNWISEIEYPELILQQTQDLLSITV